MSDDALAEAIRRRAAACGIDLRAAAAVALSAHARAVREADPRLHLTTVVAPEAFVERHLGEAFEGAALLAPDARGVLVDLGSGNGYPGLPVAAARPGLRAVLLEASRSKARFLREVLAANDPFAGAAVIDRQVQRAADLAEVIPVRVVTCRAAGNWERVLPRLVQVLAPDGEILVWAGEAMERIRGRAAWRRLELRRRQALPGRDRSWIWQFAIARAP